MRAILRDLEEHGEALFERFTARREGTLWYYGELAKVYADRGPRAHLPAFLRSVGKLTAHGESG